MKVYTFQVTIPGLDNLYRVLELREDQTLLELHYAIQRAFKFDDDHLYSFFMSGKAWDRTTEYTVIHDEFRPGRMMDPTPPPPLSPEELDRRIKREAASSGMPEETVRAMVEMMDAMAREEAEYARNLMERDVAKTQLKDLKLRKGKRFLYLFDYGDEWHFNVKVSESAKPAEDDKRYPRVVDKKGTPPPQYPEWDGEY